MRSPPSVIPHTRLWGIGMALLTAIISGFAIFTNSYGVGSWGESGVSSGTYTTAKNLVAALLLGGLLFVLSRRRSEDGLTRPKTRPQWLGLMAVGLIGGSIPFLLFFEGLARATSSQAAFIHKTLILWVVILAIPLLKERLGLAHVAALALVVWGQISLVGGITDLGLGSGELMVLTATLMWAVEVIVAKKLLVDLSPLTVGTARMGLGVVVLISYGIVTGSFAQLGHLGWSQWGWVLLTGLVLFGYVATWYSGLARAQAIDVTAVLVFGAVITAGLQSGFNGVDLASRAPGLILLTLATAVLVGFGWVRSRRTQALTR